MFLRTNRVKGWLRKFSVLESTLNCVFVYSDWFKIIRAHQGGYRVSLNIRNTDLKIQVDRDNLVLAMRLAGYLRQLRYTQQNNVIVIFTPSGYSEVVDPAKIMSDRIIIRWLGWLAATVRSGGIFTVEDSLITVVLDDLKWFVRWGSEDLRLGPLLGHVFEKHEYVKWFSKVIGRGSVFVDVGANVGGYALRAAHRGSKVYALEPSRGNYEILRRNAAINNLTPVMYRLAAYSKESEVTLYGRFGGEGKFSLRASKDAEIVEKVRAVTLDSLLVGRVYHVDLLKIDVEGLELEVLRGSKRLLEITENVMVEVRNMAAINWLTDHGFKLRDVGSSFGDSQNMFFSKI